MKRSWVVKPALTEAVLAQYPQIEPAILQLLFDRGINDQKKIDEFLNPDYESAIHDPFLFKNMEAALARIQRAIQGNEKITVHGDYDADGLSGAVILVTTLRLLGCKNVGAYMPHREKEGYGINLNTIDFLHQDKTNLIITTDCGISNVDEIAKAKSLGMDTIITDHHGQKETLPDAIILHPKVAGETYPFKDLAGGGVAFKLAQALLRRQSQIQPEEAPKFQAFEKWLLDLVAISTIADMVPLIGENRTLVKYGLIVMSKARRLGMRALLTNAKLLPPKQGKELHLRPYDVGFIIAPRLNAAGRIEHSNTAFALLISENEQEAWSLSEKLEETNKQRQQVTNSMMEDALKQIGEVSEKESTVLFAYNPEWSMGVVGLVAGRIMEKFHKPVFICSQLNGNIAASGRSIEGYDCNVALDSVKDLLGKYGGHPRACGFTIKDNKYFSDLQKRLIAFAKQSLTAEQLKPKLELDAELKISEISWSFFELLEQLQPFGMANPEPKFVSYGVEITEIAAIGQDKNHLRMTVTHDHKVFRKCIAFRYGHLAAKLTVGKKIDIVYTVDINEWNGNRELQLKIIDLKFKI